MTRFIPMLALCAACASPDERDRPRDRAGETDAETDTDTDTDADADADADADSDADADTGTPPITVVSAICEPTVHPQVFSCAITLSAEGDTEVTLSAAGAPQRTFRSDAPAVDHVLYAWGLLSGTTYDWDAAGVTGQVTTGALPAALEDVEVEHFGTLFGADGVLVYVQCGWFVVVDGDGRIIWYQETGLYDGITDGMRWSQADRSMISVRDALFSFTDDSEVVEYHVSGTELLHLEDADLALTLTHDVARWQDTTYLLGQRDDGMSAFEVFQGTTKVGEFALEDALPGVEDIGRAFANSISVSEVGEVVLSVLDHDTALALDGDPASPTFLQLLWVANGNPGGGDDLPGADYLPAVGTAFDGQHNPSLHDGELWVFDNSGQGLDSRAARFELDAATGTLVELDAWELGQFCIFQGGALPIDGGVLATCATSDEVFAYRDGAATPDWQMRATCGGRRAGSSSTRAYPVVVE